MVVQKYSGENRPHGRTVLSALFFGTSGSPMIKSHPPSLVNCFELKFDAHPTVTHCWIETEKRCNLKPLNLIFFKKRKKKSINLRAIR